MRPLKARKSRCRVLPGVHLVRCPLIHPHVVVFSVPIKLNELAPHASGPRDVPRCGALSLLQKTPHYRGDPAETAARLNVKFWVLVTTTGRPERLFTKLEHSPPN